MRKIKVILVIPHYKKCSYNLKFRIYLCIAPYILGTIFTNFTSHSFHVSININLTLELLFMSS